MQSPCLCSVAFLSALGTTWQCWHPLLLETAPLPSLGFHEAPVYSHSPRDSFSVFFSTESFSLLAFHIPRMLPSILYTRAQQTFCKGPDGKYSRFAGHRVSATVVLNSIVSQKQRRQYGKERVWLCSNKTLFMNIKIYMSYDFHGSKHAILLQFFSTI